ncbi:MAG: hypothetical protein COC08_09700 [Maribacter sp.]|nr:MAG: hypothetical protein COC08_09700 [Maribacter sp.]
MHNRDIDATQIVLAGATDQNIGGGHIKIATAGRRARWGASGSKPTIIGQPPIPAKHTFSQCGRYEIGVSAKRKRIWP